MENNIVSVMLWGEEVGKLYWDERGKRSVFNYHPDFIKKGLEIAPLTASIKGSAAKGMPMLGNREKIYQGLPPFLADSLPDRWGNMVFDQWAAQNHIPKRRLTPVDKLSFIGKRGMGAFEFVPATPGLDSSSVLQIDSLYQLARRIFEEREEISVQDDEALHLQSIYEVGTSAGGQHPKAIIAINETTHDIRSGQVPLPEGYTYYILKFAEGDDFPFTQMEMVYYEMAKEAGITMMPSRLIQIEGKHHFLTERYDRVNGEKAHIQTLAAMNPDATSYEDLFEVCRKLNIPASEQSELYRRAVFNIMGGNVDDHIKNFSFLMERNGIWHITPAYDMTFTTNLDGAAYENVHSMSIAGKDNGITEDDLLRFAKLNGIKNAKKIVEAVGLAISHFYDYATNHRIDDYWKDRIEEHLSGLVSSGIGETMKHYLPTIIEPYETEDGFQVSEINIIENTKHDFRIEAVINGKRRKYIAGRKSDLAAEIITKGRNKMVVENKKELVERLLLPFKR
ncbi:type II toxin-antitoxin system HipA family toxin [Bacteroides timonensis]|uniref:type II toxin-antitoxin system HipA family toxin n=1 Tax=Bacteroides timonensis TaxID=1470345 RepID=UPI0005C71D4A|nr:type II toxin-antitoxin system HipA family toxin [Bacteroides timonensis]